jgi:hypothetical protein
VSSSKAERLEEFLRRLDAAERCTSFGEARTLVADTLNDVEDEMSGIQFNPVLPGDDGRMYPPQDDSERSVPGQEDVKRFRSARHNTYISSEGAIRIQEVGGPCILNKPGHDGSTIELNERSSIRPTLKP